MLLYLVIRYIIYHNGKKIYSSTIAIRPLKKMAFSWFMIKKDDENREQYLERYWNNLKNNRKDTFTIKELENIKKHIFEGDFPESIETLIYLASKYGFKQANILYRDPLLLVGLIYWE